MSELELTDDEKIKLSALPGKSFSAMIGNEDSEDKAIVVFSEYGATRMIRTKKWKYIHYYPMGENELFDIENDPDEKCNLYNSAEHQDIIVGLKSKLERWFSEYVDPAIDGTKEANTGNGQIDKAGLWAEGRKNYVNSPMIGVPYFTAIEQMKEQFAKYLPQEEC